MKRNPLVHLPHVCQKCGGRIRRLYSDQDDPSFGRFFCERCGNYFAARIMPKGQELCDFCSSRPVVARLVVKRGKVKTPASGDWAACRPCLMLIMGHKQIQLLNRSMDHLLKQHPEMKRLPARVLKDTRSHMAYLQKEGFWELWTGEVFPFDE